MRLGSALKAPTFYSTEIMISMDYPNNLEATLQRDYYVRYFILRRKSLTASLYGIRCLSYDFMVLT